MTLLDVQSIWGNNVKCFGYNSIQSVNSTVNPVRLYRKLTQLVSENKQVLSVKDPIGFIELISIMILEQLYNLNMQ